MLGDFPDLVQENGTLSRFFKKALLVGQGACKRTFHMTKGKTFEDVSGKSAAIHRQKQFAFPVAMTVNGKAINSFPVPLSPVTSMVAMVLAHFLDHLQDVPNRFALANNIFEMKFHLEFVGRVHHV